MSDSQLKRSLRSPGWDARGVSVVSIAALLLIVLSLAGIEWSMPRMMPAACARANMIRRVAEGRAELLAPCAARVVEHAQEVLQVGSTWGRVRQMPLRRTPGVLRIAIVGESSGELLGNALDELAAEGREGRYEVVNCARAAADLDILARMFDEVLRYAPDVVIVIFGHNIRYHYKLDAWRLSVQRFIGTSCLLTALAPLPPGDDGLEMAPLASQLAGFERFLRHAAATTRSGGVRLVFSTMATNLWLPPRAGDKSHDEAVGDAMRLDALGRVDAALERLSAPGGEPGVRPFLIGILQARSGRAEDARKALHRALDEDPAAYRAPTAVNALVRQIAVQTGTVLRDTEHALEGKVAGGLPGWESFVDNCHLIPELIREEAGAMFRLADPEARGSENPGDLEIPAVAAGANEFPLDHTISGAFDTYLNGFPSPFSEGLTYAVGQWLAIDERRTSDAVSRAVDRAERQESPRLDVLLPIADALAHAGRMGDALRLNERARQLDPSSSHAWQQAALFALRSGDTAAARSFAAQATGLDPRDRTADSIIRTTDSGTR